MSSAPSGVSIAYLRGDNLVRRELDRQQSLIAGRADGDWTPDIVVTTTDTSVGRRALVLHVNASGGVVAGTASLAGCVQISRKSGHRVALLSGTQQMTLPPGRYALTVVGGSGIRFQLTLMIAQPSSTPVAMPGKVTRAGWDLPVLLTPTPDKEWMTIGALAALLATEPGVDLPAGQRLLLAVNAWFPTPWPKNGRYPNQLNLLLRRLAIPHVQGQDKVPLIAAHILETNLLTDADLRSLHHHLHERAAQRLTLSERRNLGLSRHRRA